MTFKTPNPPACIFALPAVALIALPAQAAASPIEPKPAPVETGQEMTPDEAASETARILANLRALRADHNALKSGHEAPEIRPALQKARTSAPQPEAVKKISASGSEDILGALVAIRSELAEQKRLIAGQNALIRSQSSKIRQLELHNDLIRAATPQITSPYAMSRLRGAGIQQEQLSNAAIQPGQNPESGSDLPDAPVGEAPPETQNIEQKVEAVPEGQGVLTPRGQFVIDPSIEYTRSSTNRLVFRGIELIPGIQIGAIEASDADRDTIIGTFAMRYGLTRRLEIEGRIPLLYRKDRIQVVQQREDQIVREIGLDATDIGDAEFSLRYQLNEPKGQNPIWVAGLRVKTDTGVSPYEIPFDSFGVATGLATGSGFWGIQPSMSFLLPSDPVVIYGGVGYLWNIERNIDRVVGDVFIGKVDPGDAINANVGFGFALNPRFSFSLGYGHNYIFSTKTQLGNTLQESNDIQVGSFNFGMSYRLSERQSLSLGFKFGATEDAPDVGITMRIPFRF